MESVAESVVVGLILVTSILPFSLPVILSHNKRVAPYIFAYMELINGFDESDELNVEEMIMILLSLTRYAQQSLKNIKTLKVDWVEGVLPDALDKILSSVSPQFTENLVFTPQERKTWLAYRAHYESKYKSGV